MGKSEVKGLFHIILIIATFILAGVTIAAAFSGYCAPATSTYMPVLGMAIPILLLCNLFVAICWAFGRKCWTFVPIIAILFNWNYLTAIIQFNSVKNPSTAIGGANGHLKIATYNVHSFGGEITGYSCKELARFMQQERVDVLCFQEFGDNQYFPLDSIKKILSHWKYSLVPTEDSIRGILPIAVFSRYPVINEHFIAYPNSANCSMQCDVVVGKDTIRILNNHLQTTSVSQNQKKWKRGMEAANDTRKDVEVMQGAAETLHENFVKRAEQTDQICQLANASPYPVLVCGDFNSLPCSYTYNQLSKALKDGFKSAGRGYMYTFRYFKKLLRIDYIFHSPDLEGISYYSPTQELCSDHNPVVMEVMIKK